MLNKLLLGELIWYGHSFDVFRLSDSLLLFLSFSYMLVCIRGGFAKFNVLERLMQVEQQSFRLQEHTVLWAAQNACHVRRNLNPLQFQVGGVSSDLFTNLFDSGSLSLCEYNLRLFLLDGLIDHVFGFLGVLLCNLFGFDSLLVNMGEGKLGDRDIIQLDHEVTQTFRKRNTDVAGDLLSLVSKLRGVVTRNHWSEHLVDNWRENTGIVVAS